MIKTKLNLFTLILIFTLTIFFLTIDIILIIQSNSSVEILRIPMIDLKETLFIYTWMSLFGIYIFINLLIKMKKVIIDKKSKTIKIRNYLTRYCREYTFKELDGFINSNWGPTEKGNRSIYLVKNSTKIEKISEFTIRNFDELLRGLKKIENLGYDNSTLMEKVKNHFIYR